MMYNPSIEKMSLDALRALQNERLKKLVEYVYKRVPFYKQQFDALGLLPSDIKTVEDLYKIPFTTKDDLRQNYPYGMFATPMNDIRRIHASSGTTGKPTVVGYTANDLEVFDEVVARSLACAGAKPGMILHNAYGYGLFTGGLGIHGGATKLGMAVVPVSGGMTERQVTILQDFKPNVICCTPSYAQTLSDTLLAKGINPKDLDLQHAILGAEPWTEAIRDQVQRGLGVNATNIYGLSEIIGPGVSQEDFEEQGTGSYIWEDHFYPEVVDRDTGKPLPYGQEGVLVFTTLTKEAFPVLRYWTNDICSIQYDPNGKRTHIKMSTIKGRADDMLIIRGVNLFHTQVEDVIHMIDGLSPNYRLIVSKKQAMDIVTVEVEKSDNSFDIDEVGRLLKHKIKDIIGLSMDIVICNPGTIPRSQGGKLNRIVDNR